MRSDITMLLGLVLTRKIDKELGSSGGFPWYMLDALFSLLKVRDCREGGNFIMAELVCTYLRFLGKWVNIV